MAVFLSPMGGVAAQFFDNNGVILSGGKIYTYAAGTTTPATTYTSSSGNTAHANPIILDSAGRVPGGEIWVTVDSFYKFVLKDSNDVLIATYDNIPAGTDIIALLAGTDGASYVGWIQSGTGTVATTVETRLRQTKHITDFSSLSAAFANLSGGEGTGFGANPVTLDLLGTTVTFSGTLYVPTNVSIVNGKISSTSSSDRLVWRNPFLANTGLRGYTEYWPYMTSANSNVIFDCITIINVFIGATFNQCTFNGIVLVNSNGLWTEYNSFSRCAFNSSETVGGCIRLDGNISNTSVFSTGSGAGTSDGSFGYSNFEANCRIDAISPLVGISIVDGGTLYNAHLGFQGYARAAGPSGGFMFIDSSLNVSAVSYCNFEVHLESFGAAANVISLNTNGRFWYNTGTIQSASPEMVMAQDSVVDIRACKVDVIGVVNQDSAGNPIFNGSSYMTTITSSLVQRQWIEPKFAAYADTNQTFSSNTISKLTFGTEEFDVGSYFSSSRFTPQVAGYYQINARASFNMTATTTAAWVAIYKNGTAYRQGNQDTPINDCARVVSSIVYFNGSTDYVEIYGYVFDNAGAPNTVSGIAETYFNGSFVGY